MRHTATCIAFLAATVIGSAAELRLSGPYKHDNLYIYLVHGQDRTQKKYLTLYEAMEQHKVVAMRPAASTNFRWRTCPARMCTSSRGRS